MSESTSGPSKRRKAPTNPYSWTEQYQSLALFLAAHDLPVPSALKHLAPEKDRSSCPNKRRKHVEHENNPEVCYQLSLVSDLERIQNDFNDEYDCTAKSSVFPPTATTTKCRSPPVLQRQPEPEPTDGVPIGLGSLDDDSVVLGLNSPIKELKNSESTRCYIRAQQYAIG